MTPEIFAALKYYSRDWPKPRQSLHAGHRVSLTAPSAPRLLWVTVHSYQQTNERKHLFKVSPGARCDYGDQQLASQWPADASNTLPIPPLEAIHHKYPNHRIWLFSTGRQDGSHDTQRRWKDVASYAKPFAFLPLLLATFTTTWQREGQAKPQDLLLTLLEQSSLCMADECWWWVFYRHRNYWTMSLAISFDNHLFHEVQWKSHLFSGSQVHCQKTQNTDQQSCTVCATAALITSITENPAREEREGLRGLRGSSRSTRLVRSADTDWPFNPLLLLS